MKKIKIQTEKRCKLRRYELLSPEQSKVLTAKDFTCDEVREKKEE